MRQIHIILACLLAVSTGTGVARGQMVISDLKRLLEMSKTATEVQNMANMVGQWTGQESEKQGAFAAIQQTIGQPGITSMELSNPTDSADKIQADMDMFRKLAEQSSKEGVLKERLDAYERLRLQNLVLRKQLEALAAQGRPPLGMLDRLKLATSLRALTVDHLNSLSMALATDGALAEESRAKQSREDMSAARRRELRLQVSSLELGDADEH